MEMSINIEDNDTSGPHIVDKKPVEQDALRPLGPSPPFRELCKMLDSMACVNTKESARRLHRRECLKQFFDTWRKVYGNDLYTCVRLLLPELDRERAAFGLKESHLARLYLNALGLDRQTSSVAKQLLEWRRVSHDNQSTAGDFAKLLFTVIENRTWASQTRLSIHVISEQLDSLATTDSNKKLEIVKFWLDQISPGDHLWLLRIILKDLRLGLTERSVLEFVHPHALELFNVCTDLRIVCHTLYSPQVSLEDPQSTLKVFSVFKPMLSQRSRKNLPDIVRLMLAGNNSEFVIEEKMDGERIQLHKSGNQYRFWSRQGKEYTYKFGENPTSGCLSQFIHGAFKPAVEEVILDGEILAWDPTTEIILPFGSVKSLKSSEDSCHQPRALFKVFDILYLKGKGKSTGTSLMGKPLDERRKVLESGRVFEEVKTRLELCYSTRGKTPQDIHKNFERILDERGEGLIIKKLDSKYVLNSRTNDWVKVKPDYMDELGETLEVLAVGANWGSGKRGGKFGSLLVALVDNEHSDPLQGLYRYKTLCRVGTGLNVNEMEQIMIKLEGKCMDWDEKRPGRNPDWLDYGASSGNTPDVWWHWKDSFLLTIKGAEIIPSSCYGCRLSVRFPRSIRFDIERDITDCMSYEEFLAVAVRLPDKKRFSDDLSAHVKKRQRKVTVSQPSSSLRELKRSDSNKIFYGAEFWILQGFDETNESKNDLEVMINENGGKIVHTLPRAGSDRDQFCISLRADFWDAQKVLRRNLNLIHPQWVLDSVNDGRRRSLTDPKYFVPTSQAEGIDQTVKDTAKPVLSEFKGHLSGCKDSVSAVNNELTDEAESVCHQDSREASVTSEEVCIKRDPQEFLDAFKVPCDRYTSASEDPSVPKETSPKNQMLETEPIEGGTRGIFYPLVFYLDNKMLVRTPQCLTTCHTKPCDIDQESKRLFANAQVLIESNGGKIVSDLDDPNLTHIICCQRDTSRCLDLITTNNARTKRRRLILTDWVFDSVESNTCLYETDYLPAF